MRIITCLLFVLLSSTAGAQPTAPASRPAAERIPLQLDRRLPELKFDAIALGSIMQFLQDVTGANLVTNWGALSAVGITAETKVTERFRDVKTSEVLRTIIGKLPAKQPLDFAVLNDAIVISTAADLKARAALVAIQSERKIDPELQKRLNKVLPQLSFDRLELRLVLDFFSDVAGVRFDVDWDKLKTVGLARDTKVTIRLADIAASQALTLILMSAGGGELIDWIVVDGKIRIVPARDK